MQMTFSVSLSRIIPLAEMTFMPHRNPVVEQELFGMTGNRWRPINVARLISQAFPVGQNAGFKAILHLGNVSRSPPELEAVSEGHPLTEEAGTTSYPVPRGQARRHFTPTH